MVLYNQFVSFFMKNKQTNKRTTRLLSGVFIQGVIGGLTRPFTMPHRFQVKQKLGTCIDLENNFQVPNCEGAVSASGPDSSPGHRHSRAVPKFSRKLGRVSNFSWSINWHQHMKDHVEIGHLTKYDAFRVNRDQVMDLEIWFKIHTNVSNFETASSKTL